MKCVLFIYDMHGGDYTCPEIPREISWHLVFREWVVAIVSNIPWLWMWLEGVNVTGML